MTEVVVAARDRQGLFADLAMTIAALGGNVLSARIFTSRQGDALDIFQVQDAGGRPFAEENQRLADRLVGALEDAARGQLMIFKAGKYDLNRASAFAIASSVVMDNEASSSATVIETSGRDRPGLLATLARTLSDANLSIQSAHIDNHGERAVDAFYVVDAGGGKLTSPAALQSLRVKLSAVLDVRGRRGRRAEAVQRREGQRRPLIAADLERLGC